MIGEIGLFILGFLLYDAEGDLGGISPKATEPVPLDALRGRYVKAVSDEREIRGRRCDLENC